MSEKQSLRPFLTYQPTRLRIPGLVRRAPHTTDDQDLDALAKFLRGELKSLEVDVDSTVSGLIGILKRHMPVFQTDEQEQNINQDTTPFYFPPSPNVLRSKQERRPSLWQKLSELEVQEDD